MGKIFYCDTNLVSDTNWSNMRETGCFTIFQELPIDSVSQSDEEWMDGLMGSAAKEVLANAARVAC